MASLGDKLKNFQKDRKTVEKRSIFVSRDTLWSQNEYFRLFVIFLSGALLNLLCACIATIFKWELTFHSVVESVEYTYAIRLYGLSLIIPVYIMILCLGLSVYFCYKYEISRFEDRQGR